MSDDDHFADIRHSLRGGFGVLGGEGVEQQYSVREDLVPNEGVRFTVNCENCGSPCIVKLTFDQQIYGFRKVEPGPDQRVQGSVAWRYNALQGGFQPLQGCWKCKQQLSVIVTPDECQRHLNAAEHAGMLSRQAITQAIARVDQQRAQQYGR